MKTESEFLAEQEKAQAEALTKFRRESAFRTELRNLQLPIEPTSVCLHRDHISASFQTAQLREILESFKAARANLVQIEDRTAGCRSLQPFALLGTQYLEGKDNGAFDASLRIHVGGGFHAVAYDFWVELSDGTYAHLTFNQPYGAYWDYKRYHIGRSVGTNSHGEVTSAQFTYPPGRARPDVVFGGGGIDSKDVRWKFNADTLIAELEADASEQERAQLESAERSYKDHVARRNQSALDKTAKFLLDTLDEVLPVYSWSLTQVQEFGCESLTDSVREVKPEILKIGPHDFANGVYFLTQDQTDQTKYHAADLRKAYQAAYEAKHGGAQ